ncbi:MAG: M20/M25/M40 family metallo-hydrolase [Planctomycetota bacterium]
MRTALFGSLIVAVILLLPVSAQGRETDSLERWLGSITAADAEKKLNFLASDLLEGRETGKWGLKVASRYIAREFKRIGLKPVGDDGTYYQHWRLNDRISLGENNRLAVIRDGEAMAFELESGFSPFLFSGSGKVEGEVVFAGYGITAPQYDWDDYKGIDVKGKIVLVLRHEPEAKDPASRFDGLNHIKKASWAQKALNAQRHGAVGMIMVTGPLHGEDPKPVFTRWEKKNEKGKRPQGPFGMMSGMFGRGFRKGMRYDVKIPAAHVSMEVATALFGKNGKEAVGKIQEAIDEGLRPMAFPLPDIRLRLQTDIKHTGVLTRNVVGLHEGSDPELKKEVIVIGAHYDHVGMGGGMARLMMGGKDTGDDRICNGADDNASGTVGVMLIARAFATNQIKTKRSILFILFSGEEKGLVGSGYYVHAPIFPLGKTTAMFNMDMISRNPDKPVSIQGNNASLKNLAARHAETLGMKVRTGGFGMMGNSDYHHFRRLGVPTLSVFTGFHRQLHQPSDEAWRCSTDLMAKISQLFFLASLDLARGRSAPEKPVMGAKLPEKPKTALVPADEMMRKVLGVGHGLFVQELSDTGILSSWGVKKFDLLLTVNGTKLDSREALVRSVKPLKRGDRIELVLIRRAKRITLNCTR